METGGSTLSRPLRKHCNSLWVNQEEPSTRSWCAEMAARCTLIYDTASPLCAVNDNRYSKNISNRQVNGEIPLTADHSPN